MDFPRLVYKNGGPHQRAGGTYSHALVKDQTELDAHLEAGWFATLPEAITPKPVEMGFTHPELSGTDSHEDDNKPPTRAELEAKANELGLVFSPNIGDKKLLERIQARLDEMGANP